MNKILRKYKNRGMFKLRNAFRLSFKNKKGKKTHKKNYKANIIQRHPKGNIVKLLAIVLVIIIIICVIILI